MEIVINIGIFLLGYFIGGEREYKRLAGKDQFNVKLLEALFLKIDLEKLNNFIREYQYDTYKTHQSRTLLDKALLKALILKRNKLMKKIKK